MGKKISINSQNWKKVETHLEVSLNTESHEEFLIVPSYFLHFLQF